MTTCQQCEQLKKDLAELQGHYDELHRFVSQFAAVYVEQMEELKRLQKQVEEYHGTCSD